jgi:exodeoxyribonuclease VII small subunit
MKRVNRRHGLVNSAPMVKKQTEQAPDFESALKELEALVERMESGDLPLEEALKLFERGVELTRTCQSSLKQAELKVEQLIERGGHAELAPLADASDDD